MGVERKLAEQGDLRPIHVLKVPHHGSRTFFLTGTTRTDSSLIAIGSNDPRRRHPHESVRLRFERQSLPALWTSEDGGIWSAGQQVVVPFKCAATSTGRRESRGPSRSPGCPRGRPCWIQGME